MASNKYVPTISKQEFDAIAADLRAALKSKYDASKSDADRPPANPATKGAFDHMPDLDSKTVAKWSSVVKNYLGCKLDPDLIQKGGYDSFDDFWADIQPKLRSACPNNTGAEATAETGIAS
ncbi:hypothetical protein [Corallococcus exiguus]|uniref:hypothetical protein n=1 Tax=Corallococcus exiguus TaxID=83462 RepID=UPI003DA593B4